MFFFRPNSKNCILEALLEILASSRLLRTSSLPTVIPVPYYLSTVHLVLTAKWPVSSVLHPKLMPKTMRLSAIFALAISLTVPAAQAYEPSLNSGALHDAYILGQRNDQTTAEFLDPYSKQVSGAVDGGTPHLSEIEVLTPFALVVDESRQKLSGFSEQQATVAYHKRGDTVVIRIRLVLPAAYPESERGAQAPAVSNDSNRTANLRPENFWQKFQFAVKQNGKTIPTKSIHNQPVYSAATKNSPSTLDGQTVWLEYDAKSIANDQITVEVKTPDGKTAASQFDLKALR
jgi:hypothetical protein